MLQDGGLGLATDLERFSVASRSQTPVHRLLELAWRLLELLLRAVLHRLHLRAADLGEPLPGTRYAVDDR